jgi:hypothetical protein
MNNPVYWYYFRDYVGRWTNEASYFYRAHMTRILSPTLNEGYESSFQYFLYIKRSSD